MDSIDLQEESIAEPERFCYFHARLAADLRVAGLREPLT
jgi:hypothetical protein